MRCPCLTSPSKRKMEIKSCKSKLDTLQSQYNPYVCYLPYNVASTYLLNYVDYPTNIETLT